MLDFSTFFYEIEGVQLEAESMINDCAIILSNGIKSHFVFTLHRTKVHMSLIVMSICHMSNYSYSIMLLTFRQKCSG